MIALLKKFWFRCGAALVTMSWMLTFMPIVNDNADTTRMKEAANDTTRAKKTSELTQKSLSTRKRNLLEDSKLYRLQTKLN